MKYKDSIDFFNNYRNNINDKSKVTIGYDSTIKIVEAYELLEGHIQDLTEDKKNLLLDFEAIKGLMAFWREQDSSGHYDILRDIDEIVSKHIKSTEL